MALAWRYPCRSGMGNPSPSLHAWYAYRMCSTKWLLNEEIIRENLAFFPFKELLQERVTQNPARSAHSVPAPQTTPSKFLQGGPLLCVTSPGVPWGRGSGLSPVKLQMAQRFKWKIGNPNECRRVVYFFNLDVWKNATQNTKENTGVLNTFKTPYASRVESHAQKNVHSVRDGNLTA